MQILVGVAFALLISLVAFFLRFLTWTGALAALVLGTIVFGLGGLPWAVLLVLFFTTSSSLSLLPDKSKDANSLLTKRHEPRNAWQVLANGGAAGIFVIVHALYSAQAWTWIGYAASLASAAADTWSTEIGAFSKKQPVSMISGKQVQKGESGGITWMGTFGGILGSALIAITAILIKPADIHFQAAIFGFGSFLLIFFIGIIGDFLDSFLGATVQVRYTCPACQISTEKHPLHTCGTLTIYSKGRKWLDNNWVNGISSTLSGILAWGVLLLLQIVFR